jgi:ribosomal protein L11
MFNIKNKVSLFVRAQCAETGPPLGTVLGNLGVNAIKFTKEFNDFTKDLPSYFFLKVHIFILEDRSYQFSVFLPSTGFILSFVKSLKFIDKNRKHYFVILKDVIQLAILKFPHLSLQKSLPIIVGTVVSCGLFIVF